MEHVGRLFLAYGFSSQAYDLFLANGLTRGEQQLDATEYGLITQRFRLDEVEAMFRDGRIRDAATVAAFGLLRIKQLI